MKKLIALSLFISLPVAAMNPHAESVSGNTKRGQAGFFQDAVSFAASPVAAAAEQAAKIVAESMAKYKEEFIAEAAAKATAANAAQIKALQDQLNKLQKTVDEQNKPCCSIQ